MLSLNSVTNWLMKVRSSFLVVSTRLLMNYFYYFSGNFSNCFTF